MGYSWLPSFDRLTVRLAAGITILVIVPLAITAIFSILLCLFPNTLSIYDLAQTAVKDIFGGL